MEAIIPYAIFVAIPFAFYGALVIVRDITDVARQFLRRESKLDATGENVPFAGE